MGKGIVAYVWGFTQDRDYPISEYYLREEGNNQKEIPLIERCRTYHAVLSDIFKLLVDDYEIRDMSCDQVTNYTPDYGFFCLDHYHVPDQLPLFAPAFDVCRKVFILHDFHSFYLNYPALPFFKEHKERISGLLVHNPNIVDVVEKVTGIKTLLSVPNISGVEEVFSQETKDPIKELLVVGGVNERGGAIANTFAECHFPHSYDVIQRNPHTESVDLLAGCSNFYEWMEYDVWGEFIMDYKYLIDGSDTGCSSGRVGWDAFCSGRSFIGVKNRSYSSYLFDAISIDSELGIGDWQDIGWQKARQLAKERLVTEEEIHAIWSQVL